MPGRTWMAARVVNVQPVGELGTSRGNSEVGNVQNVQIFDWWVFKPCCFVVILKTQTHLYRTVYCVYCVTWECTGSYTVYITHVSSSCACCSWANDLSFKSLSKSEVDMMCSDEIKAFLEGMSIAHYLEPRTDFPKESSMEKDKRPVLQTWVDKIMFLETESDLKSVRRGEKSLFDRWKIWKCPMLPT